MRNIRFAIRGLAMNPVVSILSLALGIGANTAIFSLFEQTLLRNLPVAEPMELVNLTANGPRSGSNSTTNAGGVVLIAEVSLLAGTAGDADRAAGCVAL